MSATIIRPKYFLTPDDRRGILVVNGATAFSFVWTAFLTRLFQRVRLREWKPDDWLLAAAMVLDTIHSGIVFHLIDLGLGISLDSISPDRLHQLSEGAFVAQILYVTTLFTSKCSVLLLYLRLAPRGNSGKASWALIAASVVWVVISIILIAVPCNTLQSYSDTRSCPDLWSKWQAITIIDMVLEVFIFSIAVQLLWGLQLRFRAKFTAILAFAARLPVIVAAAIRLYYLHKRLTGESYTSEYIIATQWQMCITIMASVVTSLGPFLRPFSKEYTPAYKTSEYGRLSKRSVKDSFKNSLSISGRPLRSANSGRSPSFMMQTLSSPNRNQALGDEVRILEAAGEPVEPTITSTIIREPPRLTPDPSWRGINKRTDIRVNTGPASHYNSA